MIGQTLDRYRIESKLGEGGMGVVYKARDTQLDRIVALKVLPADKVSDPDRKQRFIQEAKAASALNHPNIVTVHDVRSDGGVDFIVMEYADGRTLEQVIPAKGLAVTQALRYAVQISDALATAHDAGIVHRDLKPSNVIVTDGDRIKILDFGIAKLLDPSDVAADARTQTTPLTGIGTIVGTAAYMSPEQAEGRKIDARSDIFSFGAVLYEMVTGRRAFAADSHVTVLARIVNDDPPPPSTFTPSLPSEVERTILRCLRKDPARRFQTMADLKAALEDLAAETAPASAIAPQTASPLRRTRWAPVVLAIAAIAAAVVTWQYVRSPGPAPATLRAVPLTTFPGVVRSPSFSPDGNQVAFTWSGPAQDNRDVYVQQIGAGVPLRLTTDAAADHSPAWSPDGRTIAFLRPTADPRREELRLVPPLGGPERKVTEIKPRGFIRQVTLAWCPDSSCIVLTDTSGDTTPDALYVVSIESGEKRQLTSSKGTHLADTDPALSPDGRWLVFRRDEAPFSGKLQLLQLGDALTAEGEPRVLTSILLGAYAPAWISNDEFIFSAKESLWRMSTRDGSTPQRLPFVGEDGLTPAVSGRQGGTSARLVYVRSFQDTNIWRIDTSAPGVPASSPPVVAISSTRRDELPQISPDSRRVTFMSGRSGEWEVWAADVSGNNAVQLTSLGANPGFPRWSPKGDLIAFHSNSEIGPGEIYVIPADGGKPRNLTSHPANDTFPSFSHDEKWIYFTSARGGPVAIWKMPVSGGDPIQVSPNNAFTAVESTDGRSLYYVEGLVEGIGSLWQQPLGGSDRIKLLDGLDSGRFDVVERGVYYIERLTGDSRLRFFDFASRRTMVVAEHLGNVATGLGVSRDGRTIMFSRVDSSVDDLMLVENFR